MPDSHTSESDAASQEVVKTAAIHADAIEVARVAQLQAHDDKTRELFETAITNAFGEYKDQQRFIDLKRVPLICANIVTIHDDLKDMKDMMKQVKIDLDAKDSKNDLKYVTQQQFSPYKWGLTIAMGVIITSLVAAVLAQILIK